jgi:hypothetical protein
LSPHQFQFDRDVYLVMDDLGGEFGRIWRETSVRTADPETILAAMLDDQYSNPVQVIAFNTLEHWSRDVSENVAHKLRRRCGQEGRESVVSAGFRGAARTRTSKAHARSRLMSSYLGSRSIVDI